MRTYFLALVIPFLLPAAVFAQDLPGDVDPSFVFPRPSVLEPDSTNVVALASGFIVVKSHVGESSAATSTLQLTLIDAQGRVLNDQYGRDGTVTNELPGPVNVARAAKRLANGSMLLAGYRREDSADGSVAAIVRLSPDGRLDESFGDRGVASFDVKGQFDRVTAVDVLPDGCLVALVWSMAQKNPYDCSPDAITVVVLNSDGSSPTPQYSQPRDSFGGASCQTPAAMQALPDGSVIYGSEVGIFDGAERLLPGNWNYGPFAMDPTIGLIYTTIETTAGEVFSSVRKDQGPFMSGIYHDLDQAAEFQFSPTVWSTVAPDVAHGVVYVGLASYAGEVAVARFRLDGSIDTGWGGGDGVVAIAGSGGPSVAREDQVASDVRLLAVQPDGDVVVATGNGVLQRLKGGSAVAHGAFILDAAQVETAGVPHTLPITVRRVGGSSGPVSVDYAIAATDCVEDPVCAYLSAEIAKAGENFVASSGRLEWADGDTSDKVVNVEILKGDPQGTFPPARVFVVKLTAPTGGAGLLVRRTAVYIDSVPPKASGSTGSGHSGGNGGGSMDWAVLCGLLLAGILPGSCRGRNGLQRRREIGVGRAP